LESNNSFDTTNAPPPAGGLELPPWERRDRFGFLNALYLTIKDVLLSPQTFFQRMPTHLGLKQPMMFAIVLGVVASFFAWMYFITGSSLLILFSDDLSKFLKGPLYSFGIFVFSPLIVLVFLYVNSAITHGMLMLFGGNKLGYEATFRVIAYSEATNILTILPFFGSGIGVIWGLVVTMIGLYSVHEIEPWKAVAAVLVPLIICQGSVSGLVGMFIFGLGS
jgi:hypothetical protein